MKRMMTAMVIAAVLSVAALAPAPAFAAPGHRAPSATTQSTSIWMQLAKMLGLGLAASEASSRNQGKGQTLQSPAPSNFGSGISTEGAIWGRCTIRPC